MSLGDLGLHTKGGMIGALILFLVGLAACLLDYSGISSVHPLEELASHHR